MSEHANRNGYDNPIFSIVTDGNAWTAHERAVAMTAQFAELSSMSELVLRAASRHFERISRTHGDRVHHTLNAMTRLVGDMTNDAATSANLADALPRLSRRPGVARRPRPRRAARTRRHLLQA